MSKNVKKRRAHFRAVLDKRLGKDTVDALLPSVQQAKPVSKPKRKAKDNFYSSWEWKGVRYEALLLHGRRCQCCGWSPTDGGTGYLVVDHIKPKANYPHLALDINNLQVLCNDCNMGKARKHEHDFRDTFK
jgi:5-methylcytosine-specific restriction endonuclease McrA